MSNAVTPARDGAQPATIRDTRRNVATDLQKSRARIAELIGELRGEVKTFAELTAMGVIAGVTEVELATIADLVDPAATTAGSAR